MTSERDSQISSLLRTAVPAPDAAPYKDWDAVLERAEAEPTLSSTPLSPGRSLRFWRSTAVRRTGLGLAVATAAVFAGVLFWPSAGGHSVLDRALAAVGDGPIIHVVYRYEPTEALVNLTTGERTLRYGESEEWLSPSGALRVASGDHVTVRAPGKLSSDEQQTYTGILDGYRDALASGSAKLSGLEKFRGRDVYWVRFKGQTLFDVGDHRNHVWSYEVAIDATTYKPVYLRHARDGRPEPITGQTIVLLETLPAGAVDFTPTPPQRPIIWVGGTTTVSDLTAQVGTSVPARTLGAEPQWLGSSYDGMRLAFLQRQKLVWGPARSPRHATGLELCYGGTTAIAQPGGRPDLAACDWKGPYVQLDEATQPSESYRWPFDATAASTAASIPEGSILLVVGGSEGRLIVGGVYVHIQARSEAAVLAAARALVPLRVE